MSHQSSVTAMGIREMPTGKRKVDVAKAGLEASHNLRSDAWPDGYRFWKVFGLQVWGGNEEQMNSFF